MAAVIAPDRSRHLAPARRPDLRLLAGGRAPSRGPAAPWAELGLTRTTLVIVLLALVVTTGGVIALGQGRFASVAPAPASATGPSVASSARPQVATGTATVLVRPGDTMWSIARRLQPSGDVRPLVDRLVAANGTDRITPGDQLLLGGG